MPRINHVRVLTAGVALTLAAAGCATESAPTTATTVTVTRTPPATTARASGSAPATGPPASGSATATTMTALPGPCDTMLPLQTVQTALNRNVAGLTAFVIGTAEADIDRIGYVNCRYGLATPDSAPAIEIGISLYGSAADAAKRIPATVDDFTAHGATDAGVTVSGLPAQLLTGGAGAGYGPTIVLSSGQRTIAVSIAASATRDARSDLTALAALALQRSAG